MHKTLALGVLLLFALSVQVPSGDQSLISTSEKEAISPAVSPQVTPVTPKTPVPKTPAIAKAPQVNPLIVAAKNMQDAAGQMALQCQRYEREYANLSQNLGPSQNLTVTQKQALRLILQNMEGDEPGTRIEHLRQDIQELVNALRRALTPSKTN
jgi:hypothetical protein